jgi:hypothetical protein
MNCLGSRSSVSPNVVHACYSRRLVSVTIGRSRTAPKHYRRATAPRSAVLPSWLSRVACLYLRRNALIRQRSALVSVVVSFVCVRDRSQPSVHRVGERWASTGSATVSPLGVRRGRWSGLVSPRAAPAAIRLAVTGSAHGCRSAWARPAVTLTNPPVTSVAATRFIRLSGLRDRTHPVPPLPWQPV